MSKFKTEIQPASIDGKLYLIDKALVPALRYVPADLLPPLLATLDRELRARHTAWMKANKRVGQWRLTWMDEAIDLLEKGNSYANIGRILEARGRGNADRIARTLAEIVVRPKKKYVIPQQRT